ncbi:hypothetical protein NMY22_g19625 [Coprinellus aureogranulatus]|nr:hypothetical protein NMY22_g19625 [Coprinellus aureogranulatus]
MRQLADTGAGGSGLFGGGVTRPVIEKTQYERNSFSRAPTQSRQTPAPAPWDDEQQTLQVDSPPQAEKRKRDELEEFPMSSDAGSMPPPKTKGNPFARKPGQESTTRNPFARSVEKQGSLHKSESFFDKVDASEFGTSSSSSSSISTTKKRTNGSKPKEKPPTSDKDTGKKEARQATLPFGMITKKPKPKPAVAAPTTPTDNSESQLEETQFIETQEERQEETQEDTQNTIDDVSMGDSLLEETQLVEEVRVSLRFQLVGGRTFS